MAPKDQWAYVANNGPNKETLHGRLLSREMVEFTFERTRPILSLEEGRRWEHQYASFFFRILELGHFTHSKSPDEAMTLVFRDQGRELWRVRGYLLVGKDKRDPHSWVYVELKYTTVTRHADFLQGLKDLRARREFLDAFTPRKKR